MLPYQYLNLDIQIGDWKSKIIDFEKRQMYCDARCQLVNIKSKNFLANLGLVPYYGMLWNWPPVKNLEDCIFHIDGSDNKSILTLFALNFLLQGTPSITEWVEENKCTEILDNTLDEIYQTTHRAFLGNVIADYSAPINQYPMLIRVDIPHRVRGDIITDTRWTYSMRFVSKKFKPISYHDACSYLEEYILVSAN